MKRFLVRLRASVAALVAVFALAVPAAASAAPEPARLTIAVGGQSMFYFLPLTLADRLGYFRDEGLTVTIADFAGGAKALQALVGGSVDMVAGSYEHVLNMQARGQELRAVAVLGRSPGIVLGLAPERAAQYRSARDLKGLKVGVTVPGSSTHIFLKALLARDGASPDDVSVITLGGAASAVAAMQQRRVDAIVNVDPVITRLEASGDLVVAVDTRTPQGQRAIYGDDYAAAVMFAREPFVRQHPQTVQAVVNAMVRALRWLQRATPQQVASVMPPEFQGGDPALYRAALEKNLAAYSPDGLMSPAAAASVLRLLRGFEPAVQQAGERIDLKRSYDNRFVLEAQRQARR